jgi:phage gpG-like protein
MSSSSPSVSVSSNAAEVSEALAGMAARIGDPQPALERARRMFAEQEAEVWGTEGAILGAHWSAAAEPAHKTDSRLLVASGRLRASLAGTQSGRVTADTLELGTDVPYARFHQYGTRNMPARRILGLSPALQEQIMTQVQQW